MAKRLSLDGAWTLHWYDGQRGTRAQRLFAPDADLSFAIKATVPGEVHLDLIKAGIIEEPNPGLNSLSARWVEERFWIYRRTFNVPKLAPAERAHLVFETLDIAAVIWINGVEVGKHANAFHPCRLDVTGKLLAGENVITVQLDSGIFHTAERQSDGMGMSMDNAMLKRNWLRKTQSSFAWDWAPRLLNVGISGNVHLEINRAVRFDRAVALSDTSVDLHRGIVTARAFAEGLDDTKHKAVLTAEIAGTGRKAVAQIEIKPGLHAYEVNIELEDPELWWPVGHGKQPLYTVKVALSVGGVVHRAEKKVGFRHVRINQDKHPESGTYFIIEINGKPIFAKGGNFVPADIILARIDRVRYATLVDRALESNFNMLRVWGGGLYESDDFYEICDERGVLVWQEFVFACAKYPSYNEDFLASVRAEATHQVRRLAHHPSLVIWCGNNELEWGCHGWGYEKGVALPDYAIYHLALPKIVSEEDGTRYFQPSSPFSPELKHPNQDDTGDQHPWSVGMANTDFRAYRNMICRFPNEGGILGPNSLPTVRACLPPGQEYPHSFAWETHENSIAAWEPRIMPDAMLEQWLGKKIQDMSIEDWVYYGGIVQGEGLSEYIRNFRRRMFSSASAIFWMYNDVWPTVRSWTTVDYYLRRTPAFWPVRRACKPLAVFIACEDNRVCFFGVNEGPEWQGALRFGFFALSGKLAVDRSENVRLPANASTLLAELSFDEWTRVGEKTHGAFAILTQAGEEVSRDRLFLPFFKDMHWPKAKPQVRLAEGKAIFTSTTFAWRVCLDLDGEIALPDNFFDILPGIPTVLDWPGTLGRPRILRVGNL